MNLFHFIPGYESYIYDADKEPLLFAFLAFLITFALVRIYTRLARSRGWGSGSVGGVHMHHMVPGVILMVVGGLLALTPYGSDEVVFEIAAILFGVGAALTLDEFAMVLHLRDVYWAEEGRSSVDALLMGLAASGLILVTAAPSTSSPGIEIELGGLRIEVGFFAAVVFNTLLCAVTFIKKKPFLGTVAMLVFPVSVFTAIRLAKPGSPWARYFYDPGRGSKRLRGRRERKRERSQRRFTVGWSGRFERWFSDLVGGAPTEPDGHGEPTPDATPRIDAP
jgi:hypothetical protein